MGHSLAQQGGGTHQGDDDGRLEGSQDHADLCSEGGSGGSRGGGGLDLPHFSGTVAS